MYCTLDNEISKWYRALNGDRLLHYLILCVAEWKGRHFGRTQLACNTFTHSEDGVNALHEIYADLFSHSSMCRWTPNTRSCSSCESSQLHFYIDNSNCDSALPTIPNIIVVCQHRRCDVWFKSFITFRWLFVCLHFIFLVPPILVIVTYENNIKANTNVFRAPVVCVRWTLNVTTHWNR